MTPEALAKIANPKKIILTQIEAYQKQKNIDFTPEYVEFLLRYNGILEFPGWYCSDNGNGMGIDMLYALDDRYDLWEGNEEDRYGFDHYMIGRISTGDEIIQISEKGEHYGKIMFWNHEIAWYSDPIEEILGLGEKPAKEDHLSLLMKITAASEAAAEDDEADPVWSPWEYVAPDLKTFLDEIAEDK